METTTPTTAPPATIPGKLPARLGLALIVLPVLAYFIQLRLHVLRVPWYLPLVTALGALCMAWAFVQHRGVGQLLLLFFVCLLTVAETAFLFHLALPPYTGPVAVGKPMPAFQVVRADDSAFTQENLSGDQNSVFVFFRGRW